MFIVLVKRAITRHTEQKIDLCG